MRVDLNDARQCRAFAAFFNHLATEPVAELDRATCDPSATGRCTCAPLGVNSMWGQHNEYLKEELQKTQNTAHPFYSMPDCPEGQTAKLTIMTEEGRMVAEFKPDAEPAKSEALEPDKPKRVRASRAKVKDEPETVQEPETSVHAQAVEAVKELVETLTDAPKPEATTTPITVELMRSLVAPLVQKSANYRVTIKNHLAEKFDAESLAVLDKAHYEDMYAYLKDLTNEAFAKAN